MPSWRWRTRQSGTFSPESCNPGCKAGGSGDDDHLQQTKNHPSNCRTREFKLEAVNLVVTRGVSVAQAFRDLDVLENVMRRRIREFHSGEGQAFPGHGVQNPNNAELTRLRREVAKLKMERKILKKALAFFAKEST